MTPAPSRFRLLRWLLFALGICVMLTAMFYTAENWRGHRAWERCRRQLQAQGAVLDWSAYLPAPVPDDQNAFKAPWMEDWFVRKPHAPATSGPLAPPLGTSRNTPPNLSLPSSPILLAEAEIVPASPPDQSSAPPTNRFVQTPQRSSLSSSGEEGQGAEVSVPPIIHSSIYPSSLPSLRLDDPALPTAFLSLLLTNYAFGSASCTLVAHWPTPSTSSDPSDSSDSPAPLRLLLLSPPSPHPPSSILPSASPSPLPPIHQSTNPSILPSPSSPLLSLTNLLLTAPGAGHLRLQPVSTNTYRVYLIPHARVILAADYLAWSDQFTNDFNNMRQALARPYAQLTGDFQRPIEIPVPNFVHLREVAQTLAQRAQSHLLLGQPDAALQDLTLLHDLCRLLDARPVVLVSAMIKVALTGLHASVVADGLRLHAWREPQLAALQQQLADTHLLTSFQHALQTEAAASSRALEQASYTWLADLSRPSPSTASLLNRFKSGDLPLMLAPRGWTYQNRANLALAEHAVLEQLDPEHQLLHPHALDVLHRRLTARLSRFSPYTYVMNLMLPNCVKAAQTTARNQTQANEAFLACALERYRLAHGAYPATLDALVPQFAQTLPPDLIGGRPLHYRPTPSGFLLYSVGWNETDDGGLRTNSVTTADWPWP